MLNMLQPVGGHPPIRFREEFIHQINFKRVDAIRNYYLDNKFVLSHYTIPWKTPYEQVKYDLTQLPTLKSMTNIVDSKIESLTITLRGLYKNGRNSIIKEMSLIDKYSYYLTDSGYPNYMFQVFPMFKTIIVGAFVQYLNPYNYIDRFDIRDISIDKYMDYVSEIYEDERFKGWNFIFDGSKFQPYLNKMRDHAKFHGREKYYDLYIVDPKTYDYLTTPLQRCYYDKYGWNKYPKLGKDYCTLEDNLYQAFDLDIPSFYQLSTISPFQQLMNVIYFNLEDITHYRHKPLT